MFERRERFRRCPNGPCPFWISRQALVSSLRLRLYDDSFHMFANACEACEMCRTRRSAAVGNGLLAAITALVAHPLRLRTRRTLFGSAATGAIFLDAPGGGGRVSCSPFLGLGRKRHSRTGLVARSRPNGAGSDAAPADAPALDRFDRGQSHLGLRRAMQGHDVLPERPGSEAIGPT